MAIFTYCCHKRLTRLHHASSYVIPSRDVHIQLETTRCQYIASRQARLFLSRRFGNSTETDRISCHVTSNTLSVTKVILSVAIV